MQTEMGDGDAEMGVTPPPNPRTTQGSPQRPEARMGARKRLPFGLAHPDSDSGSQICEKIHLWCFKPLIFWQLVPAATGPFW